MQKRVRIKDIAKMAGVSTGTVDRVLHNRGSVSEKARKSVEKVLKQVNYRPNIHVSSLSLKRTYKIAVTTPEVDAGEYWESIHNGLRHALNEYENIKVKFRVFTYNQYDTNSCRKVFEKIAEKDIDGVIIGPTFHEETVKLCNQLEKKEIPYLFVDSTIGDTDPLAFYSADHYVCGQVMAKLVTSIIPKDGKIGILQAVRKGEKSANTTILRIQGFTDFLKEKGCSNPILRIPFSATAPGDNKTYLSRFFKKNDHIPGVVVMNSRGNFIANYLYRNNITNTKIICMDLTSQNVEALKKGQIDFLIGQGPEYQGFFAMKTLLEYLIFKHPVQVQNYVQLDILTKETIDYYKRFTNIVY